MCGVNGIIEFPFCTNGGRISPMNKAIGHRGGDFDGIWQEGPIAFGHRRLAIIDLSPAGQQPMHSNDGRYTIVFNGEIYNYRELRRRLQEYDFQSSSDTETIIAAFSYWGIDCLKEFEGMFAFAIWDNVDRQVYLVRDRLGIKPLYFWSSGGVFIFSSEIRGILASELVPRCLDYASVEDFFRFQTVHAPATIIKDVQMLLPGHYMQISEQQTRSECYWHLGSAEGKSPLASEHIHKDIRCRLFAAVEKRLVADVPFGAFLSGGIDSSIIVAVMSRLMSSPVSTFSVTFGEEKYNEGQFARMIADRFKTDHHEIRLLPQAFLELSLQGLEAMDHPSGNGINTFVVSKVTKEQGVDMAFSGLGSDELFAGYNHFKLLTKLKNYGWLTKCPSWLMAAISQILSRFNPSVAADKICDLLSRPDSSLVHSYPLIRQLFLDDHVSQLLENEKIGINRVADTVQRLVLQQGFTNLPFLSQISCAELTTYLQNVLLRDTDQMSMAHTLEVRVPFLDHELVEYVLTVPDTLKYPSTPKKLLLDAVGEMLPEQIWNRPKMGFILPWDEWIRNDLQKFCAEKILSLASRPGFVSDEIVAIWHRFLTRDPRISWNRVWILVVLEYWMEKNNITATG